MTALAWWQENADDVLINGLRVGRTPDGVWCVDNPHRGSTWIKECATRKAAMLYAQGGCLPPTCFVPICECHAERRARAWKRTSGDVEP